MRATVLVLSVDEAPLLAWSLPAVAAQDGVEEILVVDDACADGTAGVARQHGARVLRLPRRLAYAAAINDGLAAASGEAVLLLNADCLLAPGFLSAALPRLAEDGVGSVAPRLLSVPAAAPAAPAVRLDAAGMVVDRRRKNNLVGHGAPLGAFLRPGEAFGADGAAALYRRETLLACAGPPAAPGRPPEVLDEDMALWASDADLAWRARLLGWRCVYEPRAVARHVRTYSPSTRAGLDEAHRRLQFRNRYLMWLKNETAPGLMRDLPFVLGYEAAALGHVLLRERHLLRGYRDAWRARAGARRRREWVQARRAVPRVPFGLRPPRV